MAIRRIPMFESWQSEYDGFEYDDAEGRSVFNAIVKVLRDAGVLGDNYEYIDFADLARNDLVGEEASGTIDLFETNIIFVNAYMDGDEYEEYYVDLSDVNKKRLGDELVSKIKSIAKSHGFAVYGA